MTLVHFHSFGQECTYILPVMQQFTHHTRTDGSQLRFGKQEDRFNSAQLAVDVGYAFLVLEILHGTDTTHDEARSLLFCKVYSKSALGKHLHPRFVLVELANAIQTLLYRHQAMLVFIDTNTDNHLIHETQRTLHDGMVSEGKGIESTGKYCFFH